MLDCSTLFFILGRKKCIPFPFADGVIITKGSREPKLYNRLSDPPPTTGGPVTEKSRGPQRTRPLLGCGGDLGYSGHCGRPGHDTEELLCRQEEQSSCLLSRLHLSAVCLLATLKRSASLIIIRKEQIVCILTVYNDLFL